MTRIDFHTNIPDKLAYACRLARKAYAAKAKIVLLAEDAEQAAKLNDALWTLSDTDFLPHVLASDPLAPETPIIVTSSEEAELPHHDMLVNLTRRTPTTFARFARVFEIISTNEDDAAAGRQRYVAYKKQSYPLTHFVAGQ
jgi:DNA polymerase-3 subunit chi